MICLIQTVLMVFIQHHIIIPSSQVWLSQFKIKLNAMKNRCNLNKFP